MDEICLVPATGERTSSDPWATFFEPGLDPLKDGLYSFEPDGSALVSSQAHLPQIVIYDDGSEITLTGILRHELEHYLQLADGLELGAVADAIALALRRHMRLPFSAYRLVYSYCLPYEQDANAAASALCARIAPVAVARELMISREHEALFTTVDRFAEGSPPVTAHIAVGALVAGAFEQGALHVVIRQGVTGLPADSSKRAAAAGLWLADQVGCKDLYLAAAYDAEIRSLREELLIQIPRAYSRAAEPAWTRWAAVRALLSAAVQRVEDLK